MKVQNDYNLPLSLINFQFIAQGRLDGAICGYDEKHKMEFLQKCDSKGVRNIEMEATAFAAFTKRTGFKCEYKKYIRHSRI